MPGVVGAVNVPLAVPLVVDEDCRGITGELKFELVDCSTTKAYPFATGPS